VQNTADIVSGILRLFGNRQFQDIYFTNYRLQHKKDVKCILQKYRCQGLLIFLLVLIFLSTLPVTLAAPLPSETSLTVSEKISPTLPNQPTMVTSQNTQMMPIHVASFGGDTVIIRLKFLKAEQAKSLVSLVIPEDKIRVEAVNNFLVLQCNESEHHEIDKILSEVDVPPIQVMFEAEAVEINRDDQKNIGIDWGSITALPGSTTGDFTSSYRIGSGKYGVNVSATINRLIDNKKGKLLASPRIAALNGTTAQILIGDKLAVEATTISNGSPITTVTYVEVGIKLEVTPFVNDDGTITAHIKPEVSDQTSVTKNGNPNIRTRQAETTLRVKNGETIILGGLMQKQETNDISKVPLLGDLPLVGGFFRTKNTNKTETELIILITPKVISQ